MKLIRGMYWPDQEKEAWINSLPESDGLLLYQRFMLDRAVATCGRRRTAVDGGAHVGLWSLALRRVFRHVVAFEPQPDNAQCFSANCGAFDNVRLDERALASANGFGSLAGSMKKSMGWSMAPRSPATTARIIRKTRLDDVPDIRNVDLIKLDVEGYEYEALIGAEQIIHRDKPIIVIEEKLDPEQRASRLLEAWGMNIAFSKKHDRLYTWQAL
jgi:FkbM family methyltransferase